MDKIPSVNEVLAHYGISESEAEYLTIFSSAKIERIGTVIAFELAKRKGRAVINYDPAYPFAVLRVFS